MHLSRSNPNKILQKLEVWTYGSESFHFANRNNTSLLICFALLVLFVDLLL